ncbi:MAG TPA: glucose-1-phosphate thymidylyltransferase [bacterium]|nr:glucose-1-phosphate thymidylyltransferase [bacterium]
MKGLILCAGKGTRMRPITYSTPKMLIPVANKPVIHYAIEAMRVAGIKQLGFVVSPENRKDLEPVLGDGSYWKMKFEYVIQEEQKGIAHAVLCAEDFVGEDDFALYLGDNLIEEGIKKFVDDFKKNRPNAAITLTPVDEPWHFGVAEVSKGRVISLVEKPKKPKSNLAVCGIYIFDKNVFRAAKSIKPSARGELEITDTISHMLKSGLSVMPHILNGWWRDTGQKSDMLEANRSVLNGIKRSVKGDVDDKSAIKGKVRIEEGAVIKRSVIEGPSVVGRGAKIIDSQIGPFSSIDDNVLIERSCVADSIIMEDTQIVGFAHRIEDSLIGNKVSIRGNGTNAISVALGNMSQIEAR